MENNILSVGYSSWDSGNKSQPNIRMAGPLFAHIVVVQNMNVNNFKLPPFKFVKFDVSLKAGTHGDRTNEVCVRRDRR